MHSLQLLLLLTIPAAAAEHPILDANAIDKSANPCQDFYQYACGNWIKNAKIPEDDNNIQRTSVIENKKDETIRAILEDFTKPGNAPEIPALKKLADYYNSCLNEAAIEKESTAGLAHLLAPLHELKSKNDLGRVVAMMNLRYISPFFDFKAEIDQKDSTSEVAQLNAGGLGLSSSGSYEDKEKKGAKIRTAYAKHVENMLVLGGYGRTSAATAAKEILALETDLAKNTLNEEDAKDMSKFYNPTDLAGLEKQMPNFQWRDFYQVLGADPKVKIVVGEPKFIAAVDRIIKTTDLSKLRNYIAWLALENFAQNLGKAFTDEYHQFNSVFLSGEKKESPRWKICLQLVDENMGNALGQAYSLRAFPLAAKDRLMEMVSNIRMALAESLKSSAWLDAPTKAAALEKLRVMRQKLGFPDSFRSYEDLDIRPGQFVQNTHTINSVAKLNQMKRIGTRVSKNDWGMNPQTVNAAYGYAQNELIFPAAFLQEPVFSVGANDAANYGAIGTIIGHEITHGFDTIGAQYDETGVQRDWWTVKTKKEFEARNSCLMKQYERFELFPGEKVNSKLTITEDAADLGGLKLAFAAYKASRSGKPAEAMFEGLNGDQQFFVAQAQVQCAKFTKKAAQERLTEDSHSPNKFRVLGSMQNSTEFAAAFSCKAGTPMAPVNRCSLW